MNLLNLFKKKNPYFTPHYRIRIASTPYKLVNFSIEKQGYYVGYFDVKVSENTNTGYSMYIYNGHLVLYSGGGIGFEGRDTFYEAIDLINILSNAILCKNNEHFLKLISKNGYRQKSY